MTVADVERVVALSSSTRARVEAKVKPAGGGGTTTTSTTTTSSTPPTHLSLSLSLSLRLPITMSQFPILSRSSIATPITKGRLLILSSTLFPPHTVILDLTTFAATHPGGELAILHFVGRDAGDEMEAYHEEAVRKRMKGFVVGRLIGDGDETWKPLSPPISLGLVKDNASPTGWRREGSVVLGSEKLISTSSLSSSSSSSSSSSLQNDQDDNDNDSAATLVGSDSEYIDKSSSNTQTHKLTSLNTDITSSTSSQYPNLLTSHLEPSTQNSISLDLERIRTLAYRRLRKRMLEHDMFVPKDGLSGYGSDIVRYLALGVLAAVFYVR